MLHLGMNILRHSILHKSQFGIIVTASTLNFSIKNNSQYIGQVI